MYYLLYEIPATQLTGAVWREYRINGRRVLFPTRQLAENYGTLQFVTAEKKASFLVAYDESIMFYPEEKDMPTLDSIMKENRQ